MKILVKRISHTQHSTIGEMYVDGVFECYTLEDVVRDQKIPGKTAIPAGTYKVIINKSNRFKRLLPLLIDVPNFEGVRIHTGNTHEDSSGCLLVGKGKTATTVTQSRDAFNKLFPKMQKAESITLTIE